jgi:hypothetical protein
MSLGKKQEKFARLLPALLNHIHLMGYEARLGDLFRDSRVHGDVGVKMGYGHKNSCHKLKLAIDINLTKDGVYLEGAAAQIAHNQIHDYWDMVGGSERIAHDLNHYSLEHQGMR